jgi:hypothetical protein
MYHCHCGYDMCKECFKEYGQIHIHDLEPSKLSEVRQQTNSYHAWFCDLSRGSKLKGCTLGKTMDECAINEDHMQIYTDGYEFGLCEGCASQYLVKK